MDIKINFKNFDEKTLNLELPVDPTNVFVNFLDIEEITRDKFNKLIDIYNKFSQSSLLIVNAIDNVLDQLKFVLSRDRKIKVILNEIKGN